VVDHVQSLGWRGHSAGHFHNGRSIAAFRCIDASPWYRLLRAAGCFVLPPVLSKRRLQGKLIASLPWLAWLLCCHAAGELAGYLAGPGDSLRRVQ
jgi:hypothetical protein